MSISNATSGATSGTRLASYFGDRSRISWGAVLAGTVVALATTLLLSLIGAAFGGGSHTADVGSGIGLWKIISLALGMAFGGYVASRLSGTHSHLDGELHGVTVWALATLLGTVILAKALGAVIGSVVVPIDGLGGTSHSSFDSTFMVERNQQFLGRNDDPTTMSPAEINDEVNSIIGSGVAGGNLSDDARTRLISLVAVQRGITKEEATRRVAQLENDAQTAIADQQKRADAIADEAARASANGARLLFTMLSLGLLGSLVGAWFGTRHKRMLHPQESHVASTTHIHSEPDHAGVRSVAVYDDAGRHVIEFLHGVNFPVSKVDLLRLARASNVSQTVAHSIEGIGEGTYVNANDVRRALGLVH